MEQTCQDAGQSLVEVVRKLLREIEKPQSRECPACSLVLKTKQPQPIQQLVRATKTVLLLFECQRDTAPASPSAVALIEQADARDPDLVGEGAR